MIPRRLAAPIAFGLLAAGIWLAGCGAPPAAGASGDGPTREVVVAGLDTMRYAPGTITAAPGEAVTITFQNTGVIPHDLVTSGAAQNVRLVQVPGGTEQRATFRATRPGSYAVICTQPGHKEAGMVGQIVVSTRAGRSTSG